MADHDVCPVWVGYILSSPLRKLIDNPEKGLSPHVQPGMTVMDVGCAMGFFSIPMARMVGPEGRVVCVDLQEKMVRKLFQRAKRRELHHRIEVRVCRPDDLNISDLEGITDFVLASAVAHEVPDITSFFAQLHGTLKSSGRLLLVEPSSRVSEDAFQSTLERAVEQGFTLLRQWEGKRRFNALLEKEPS